MRHKQAIAGNAILLALFMTLILMALLFVQVVSAKANVAVAAQRTNDAQLGVQSVFGVNRVLRTVTARLPGTASQSFTPSDLQDSSGLARLAAQATDWLPCSSEASDQRLFVGQETSCGVNSPVSAAPSRVDIGNVSHWQVPLLVQVASKLPDGSKRTRQIAGTLQTSSSASLSITAAQVLTRTLGAVPANLVFDGPVHVNSKAVLAAGRSAWPGGLTSTANKINVGGNDLSSAEFGPNPAYPCDQSDQECPNFGGGLALNAPSVAISDPTNTSGGLHLPGNINQVLLFPQGNDTGFFACTNSSCDVYVVANNTVTRIQSGVSVPGRDGQPVDITPKENTHMANITQALVVAPGKLEVRALTPTGAAYSGTMTIMSGQDLVVSSSLLAAQPVCTTYAVADVQGNIIPATCNGTGSADGLGLISQRGDILLGQGTSTLINGDKSLSLQASLLAPRGTVRVADDRLKTVDWIGSVAALQFQPDGRMRLAYDPRALHLPAFPLIDGGVLPIRLTFEAEKGL